MALQQQEDNLGRMQGQLGGRENTKAVNETEARDTLKKTFITSINAFTKILMENKQWHVIFLLKSTSSYSGYKL